MTPSSTRSAPLDSNVLEEALDTVRGSRMDSHGEPYDNIEIVRKMWSAILGMEVKTDQVSLCMMAFKIARHSNNPGRDNIVDIAGYCWVLERCAMFERGEIEAP